MFLSNVYSVGHEIESDKFTEIKKKIKLKFYLTFLKHSFGDAEENAFLIHAKYC